jgi:ubiquinone/menaquinone biosynthesis C-methylase UbiE
VAVVSEFAAFGHTERGSWTNPARASGYIELFSPVSNHATKRMLDVAGLKPGLKVLDLCCGQGNVSEALIDRGCWVTGVDFSPVMLDFARARAPSATFIKADAQQLPFGDAEFDTVVSNLGVCHVPDQPRALLEARRVLRPGGRFAMTVWCGPDLSPCFEIVYSAIKTHGSPEVSAPAAPDFHQFARPETAKTLLQAAGFSDAQWAVIDCAWDLDAPERLAEIYEKGTVRAAMLLANQPPQNLAAIRAALAQAVRTRFAHGDRWRVPVPAALVWATA